MVSAPLRTTLGLAFVASLATAAPALTKRAPDGCTSLGKGPLGFDPSDIGIYASDPPARYLGVYGSVDSNGNKVLQPGNTVPQDFELFSCKETPAQNPGKGSINAYDGYIVSTVSDGDCLTASELGKFGASLLTKPCDFSSGGIATTQHFQFQLDSFYNYYLVDFLGETPGPTANATSNFAQGQGGYQIIPDDDDDQFGADYMTLNYQPGYYVTNSQAIIAQVGDQYKAPTTMFPECRLRKTGAMNFQASADADAQAVTITPQPTVKSGAPAFTAFQFYECNSDAMGYISDPSTGIFYGHFQTATEARCLVQQNGPEGPGNGLMYGDAYGGCTNIDSGLQSESFFKYDSNSGEIHYLGGSKSSNPQPYGWQLADDGKVNLKPGSTDGIFAFAK